MDQLRESLDQVTPKCDGCGTPNFAVPGKASDFAFRRSLWQFLNKTTDPRLSMLRRFAAAMEVTVEELVKEGK